MLEREPALRITINEAFDHEWMQEDVATAEEI